MIREATEDDELEVLMLVKSFTKEAPEEYVWNKEKMSNLFHVCLESPASGLFVAEEDGSLVGFIAATLAEPMFADYTVATELAWFVDKDHRNARTSVKLLRTFEDWAESKGAKYTALADITGLRSLENLYSKLGYSSTETTYLRKL